jgi:hypothetical protein
MVGRTKARKGKRYQNRNDGIPIIPLLQYLFLVNNQSILVP